MRKRREVIDNIIDEHDGIIFGSAGDSVIAEFASPIKAAEAAVETQLKMKTMNHGKSDDDQMTFRVGINIGDVMVTDNNLFGDAVNIASRLEVINKDFGTNIAMSEEIYASLTDEFADKAKLEGEL